MSIRIRSKGERVLSLQAQLNQMGYELVEDGLFGYGTLQAVRDFQKRKGLTVDGVAGPRTLAQLLLALGTIRIPQTAHFSVGEFISEYDEEASADGIPYSCYENLGTLMERLEKVRVKTGQPLVIRSGYRSPGYNRKVGGAARSQHLFAKAADIYVKDYALSTYALAKLILEDDSLKPLFGGYGLGSQKNLHVDIRTVKDSKKPTVWWYGSKSWKAWEKAK